jgi:hypothetical protein
MRHLRTSDLVTLEEVAESILEELRCDDDRFLALLREENEERTCLTFEEIEEFLSGATWRRGVHSHRRIAEILVSELEDRGWILHPPCGNLRIVSTGSNRDLVKMRTPRVKSLKE